MKHFIQELESRNVLKVASIYAFIAWIVIQVATATFPYLHIPSQVITGIIILSVLLFPVAILISWKYELIPDEKRPEPGPQNEAVSETPTEGLTQSIPHKNLFLFFI